jgi:UDP-glucose 4-epimerase
MNEQVTGRFESMTVVVTGAAGFIGRALMARLIQTGLAAVGTTRQADRDGLTRIADYGDLADGRFAGATLVHLAETSDRATMAGGGATHAAVMQACCRRLVAGPWRHIVYVSSGTVYGDDDQRPRPPSAPARADDLYAETKLVNEASVLAHGGTVLRLANVYGPGMAPSIVLSEILAQIGGEGPVVVRDDQPVRDFIHIDDVTAGILAAVGKAPGGILNLGSGQGVSIGDLARLVLDVAGQASRPVATRRVSTRPSHIILDVSDTMARLGWCPQIPLAEGLLLILARTP